MIYNTAYMIATSATTRKNTVSRQQVTRTQTFRRIRTAIFFLFLFLLSVNFTPVEAAANGEEISIPDIFSRKPDATIKISQPDSEVNTAAKQENGSSPGNNTNSPTPQKKSSLKTVDLAQVRSYMLSGENVKALNTVNLYLVTHPESPEAHYLKGLILKKEGKLDKAEEFLKKSVELSNNNPQYLQALGEFYHDILEYRKALGVFQKLTDSGDPAGSVYRKLAELQLRLNKAEDAERSIRQALEKDPRNGQNLYIKGRVLRARGKTEEAINVYEEALAGGYDERPFLLELAALKENRGDFDRAIEINKIYINKYSAAMTRGDKPTREQDLEPYQNLARLYRMKGDYSSSLKAWVSFNFQGLPFETVMILISGFILFFLLFTKLFKIINTLLILPMVLLAGGLRRVSWLKTLSQISAIYELDYLVFLSNYEITRIEPGEPGAWFNLGMYHDRKNNLDKAVKYYRKSAELNPNMAESWFFLGIARQRLGENKEAELAFKSALRINSENNLYWFHLAVSLFEQDMYLEAVEASRQSLEILADYPPALEIFVDSCEYTGQVNLCSQALEELIRKHPKNPLILAELGNILLISGRFREAYVYFDEASSISPNTGDILINRGIAQYESGLYREAVLSMERGIELDSTQPVYYNLLGIVHLKTENFEEAEKSLLQSLKLYAEDSYAHYLLGRTLLRNNPEKGKYHLKKAIELFNPERGPHPKPRQMARDYLYLGSAYLVTGDPENTRISWEKALRYAEVTPDTISIFSDEKICTIPRKDFIEECKEKLESLNMEVPGE